MNNTLKGILLALVTLAMVFVMQLTGKPLKTATTPIGILNLEFASTSASVQNVVTAWQDKEVMNAAKLNAWLDFLFLISYGALFYFLCKQFASRFKTNSLLHRMAIIGSILAVVAAVMDMLENAGMLMSLNGNVSTGVAAFTFISSFIKWAAVAYCVCFILVALIAILARSMKQKGQN